jgi:hypothetical protein
MTKWVCTLMFCNQLYVNIVLEMSRIIIRLAMCMRIMVERDCGWQTNYSDAMEARINNNIVQSGIVGEFLAKVLIMVVNVALTCKPSICSCLSFLCHHPYITRGHRKDIIKRWRLTFFLFVRCEQ